MGITKESILGQRSEVQICALKSLCSGKAYLVGTQLTEGGPCMIFHAK